jgi:hypothetical protein
VPPEVSTLMSEPDLLGRINEPDSLRGRIDARSLGSEDAQQGRLTHTVLNLPKPGLAVEAERRLFAPRARPSCCHRVAQWIGHD